MAQVTNELDSARLASTAARAAVEEAAGRLAGLKLRAQHGEYVEPADFAAARAALELAELAIGHSDQQLLGASEAARLATGRALADEIARTLPVGAGLVGERIAAARTALADVLAAVAERNAEVGALLARTRAVGEIPGVIEHRGNFGTSVIAEGGRIDLQPLDPGEALAAAAAEAFGIARSSSKVGIADVSVALAGIAHHVRIGESK